MTDRTELQLKAMLEERTRRAGELAALNDIAGRLLSLRSPADLLPEIVDQTRLLLRVDLAYLGLVRDDPEEGQVLRLEVTSGALTPELVGVQVPMEGGLAGRIITQARPLWTVDYLADPSFMHSDSADAAAGAEHMHGLLGAPLTVRGNVIGALFASDRRPREFAEEEVTLISALASHAGLAIDNAASLERLEAAKDELARRTARLEQSLSWDRRLTDVVLRGGGVDDLLSEVRSALGVAVRLAGPAEGNEGHAAWRPIAAGVRDLATLVIPGPSRQAGDPSRDRATDEVVLDEGALLVLDRAAPVLALAMLAEEAAAEASGQARHLGLVELLTASPDEPPRRRPHQSRTARLAGLDPALDYCVAVVDVDGLTWAECRLLADGLALPNASGVVTFHGRLVVVAATSVPERLAELIEGSGRSAGVAGPASGTGGLAAVHDEAVETLQAVATISGDRTVMTSGQLGLYRVLLSHTGKEQLRAVFDAKLGPVVDEEARRGVPLLDTLRVYLDEGRRPRATATALGVHVNTLYQRLATLDRLFGEGWREPGRALELQLLLRLGLPGTTEDRGNPNG